jgi:hypothetical protein
LADPKKDETFKVVDRRLFSDTGEMRKDVAEQTEREQSAADAAARLAASAAAKSEKAAPAGGKAAGRSDASAASDAAPGSAAGAEGRQPSRTFQMLVDFIARNAAMLLGGYTDPRTGQPLLDLDGAREIIDMMDALRDSTRGNLAAEDERLLLDVIGSLKLSFMEISKAAAGAMKEKAKSRP